MTKNNPGQTFKLAPDLEKALVQGMISGHCAPEVVSGYELSKRGQGIYATICSLIKKGSAAPFTRPAVALAATHLTGMSSSDVMAYLDELEAHDAGRDSESIVRAARDKIVLVDLVNKAGEQLASGDLCVSELLSTISTHKSDGAPIQSLAENMGADWPVVTHGVEIPSLPKISEVTRGIYGIWVIAGEPGMGKSTLAWQIALDINAANYPVLYYDLDGTGETFFVDRTREIVDGSMKAFKRVTRHIYFRPGIASLEADLNRHPAPGLLIIDSPQTLPVGVRFAKESLDNWIRRFKELSHRGYNILMVSEKARSQYGEANMGGFKGTGDIEYGATMCAHLLRDEDDPNGPLKFIIVKNRHGSRSGHVADLERDPKRVFWWNETPPEEVD